VQARVEVTPLGLQRLRNMRMHVALDDAQPNEAGWLRAALLLESVETSARQLLVLGAELRVVGPPELRAEIARVASDIAALQLGDVRRA
jgi:hypothetical protein